MRILGLFRLSCDAVLPRGVGLLEALFFAFTGAGCFSGRKMGVNLGADIQLVWSHLRLSGPLLVCLVY